MHENPMVTTDDVGDETGFWMAALGAFCFASSIVWFVLREPATAQDPFVGAEGLLFGGLALMSIGLLERRRARRSQKNSQEEA